MSCARLIDFQFTYFITDILHIVYKQDNNFIIIMLMEKHVLKLYQHVIATK